MISGKSMFSGWRKRKHDHFGDVFGIDHRLAFKPFAEMGAFDEVGVHAAGT